MQAVQNAETNLETIVSRFSQAKILVIGDVMLDHYRIAEATRISPEAPVPVLLNPHSEYRLGGAAAVASMCAALGAKTTLIGVVGDDAGGSRIERLLRDSRIKDGLVWDKTRCTTVKERICGVASGRHRQQLGRIDCEDTSRLSPWVTEQMTAAVTMALSSNPDVVLISDYAKGACLFEITRIPINAGFQTIVDPPKNQPWEQYYQSTCIVPNREEANCRKPSDLVKQYNLTAAIVKMDEEGCRLQDDEIPMTRAIKSQARAVHDVTGAGDQFLSVLGCARAAGATWFYAAELANIAAGLQVERHGCVPVLPDEILTQIFPPIVI